LQNLAPMLSISTLRSPLFI